MLPFHSRTEGFVLEKERSVILGQMGPFEIDAAVDDQALAGDVARQVRQQEEHGAGDLLRAAAPSHRDSPAVARRIFINICARRGRLGRPRRHGVDPDTVQGQLERHRSDHRQHRGLGRAIANMERRRVHGAD